jgi:hypothetical protein
MKKKLKINILGKSATGKTTILYLIQKTLTEYGISVGISFKFDHELKEFRELNDDVIQRNVESLKNILDVEICEQQANTQMINKLDIGRRYLVTSLQDGYLSTRDNFECIKVLDVTKKAYKIHLEAENRSIWVQKEWEIDIFEKIE